MNVIGQETLFTPVLTKYQISKSNTASSPLFGAFIDIPKIIYKPNRESDNDYFEVKKESTNDQIEELIYEPNLDNFDLLDDDIDDQIECELVDDVPYIVIPPEEVVVNNETICKVITDSNSCILASTTARLGSNFALHSCHVSLDFVLPPTKPLSQVDPVLLVLFQSLQDIPQKICFFHSGRLGGDTRFLPPLTRVYELWEKLAHPLCSWPGD